MDLARKIRLWRGLNRMLAWRPAAAATERIRTVVNRAATMTSRHCRHDTSLPFAPATKPLREAKLAVINTAGIYLAGDEPFDIDAGRGDASFRELPSDFDPRDLRVAHAHYPHQRFDQDHNVILPIDRLRELVAAGALGGLSRRFFGFGFGAGLTKEYIAEPDGTAHEVARRLREDGADYVLLVPA